MFGRERSFFEKKVLHKEKEFNEIIIQHSHEKAEITNKYQDLQRR